MSGIENTFGGLNEAEICMGRNLSSLTTHHLPFGLKLEGWSVEDSPIKSGSIES
jgi:hypothetical protein